MSARATSGDGRTIYLDHAATTPLRDEVYAAMLPYLRDTYGNASSIHHRGREASRVLRAMRALVGETLGVREEEIIFTGSGSEANNLAIMGAARACRAGSQAREHARGAHVLISAVEHTSVLEAGRRLAEDGYDVEYVPVDTHGMVRTDDLRARLRPDTCLVSIMYANNEIGTVEPITDIGALLRAHYGAAPRPLFHTDACQAGGQLPIAPRELGVDLMSVNGSKLYGPKGVGMLYVRDGVHIAPHTLGGHQESGRRAGTENLAAIVGFAHALSLAERERPLVRERLTTFRDAFVRSIVDALPDTIMNGHPTARLPGNAHVSFPYIEGESLVLLLDTYGICASTGSACNAHDLAPSHVLRAIGQPPELIHGSLRITLGRDTTEEELAFTTQALVASVRKLRTLSPFTTSYL